MAFDEFVVELFKERGLEGYLLNKFRSQLRAEVTLRLEDSHLKIGAPEAVGTVDNPFVRMRRGGKEELVVPGSSLKGALRSHLEVLAMAEGLLPEEVRVGERSYLCTGNVLADTFSEIKKVIDSMLKEKKELKEVMEELNEEIVKCLTSPIAVLFGAPWVAARTYVGNFWPAQISTAVLSRNAIDRLTMSVAEGRLYKLEVVEPGSTFKGVITMKNVVPDPEGDPVQRYASKIFEALKEGIYLGGDKSRGGGLVFGEVTRATLVTVENGKVVRKEVRISGDGRVIA